MSDLVPHIPGLRRYARLLTGDATRADDLVQDTLERALRKWRLFGGGTGLRSWLLTIMHNVWASQMRVVRIHDEWSDEAHGAALGHAADASVAVALLMDTQRALATLPDAQRAVLLLVVVEELSYAEVAKVLDLPHGTVMSRLSRARAGMRLAMAAPAGSVTAITPTRPTPATVDCTPTSTVTALAASAATSSGAHVAPSPADMAQAQAQAQATAAPAAPPWRVVGGRR
jgi:RNA polymerase sigma-70 factor (ECF subfamily)